MEVEETHTGLPKEQNPGVRKDCLRDMLKAWKWLQDGIESLLTCLAGFEGLAPARERDIYRVQTCLQQEMQGLAVQHPQQAWKYCLPRSARNIDGILETW